MCGIAGICQIDATPLTPEAGQWVKAMTDRMAHRGPDGEGQWSHGPVCLGHRRLSIIDLSGGGQPMHSADGQLSITFNGEIYNYAELKQQLTALGGRFQTNSDTEVILEGYRIWGPDCLARFDGMFAFALWDNQQRRLFCARDRFGKKPFFYTVQHGRLYFASELTGIEQLKHLSLSTDPQAIMRYLAYEYVPTPNSMYSEVQSLPPAHMLLVQEGSVRIARYWDMPLPDDSDRRSDEELCEELRNLLARGVRRRMVSDVPLGVFLSGGIDSSIVAGLMARQSSTPIKTFSIGFTEASYDESRYARIVAKAFATDHTNVCSLPRNAPTPCPTSSAAWTCPWPMPRWRPHGCSLALRVKRSQLLWVATEQTNFGLAMSTILASRLPSGTTPPPLLCAKRS